MTTPEPGDAGGHAPPVVPAPDGHEIAQFWHLARGRAGLGRLAVVVGVGARASVPPPAWAFADTPDAADAVLARVLAGATTATSTALWELADGGERLPERGDLSIVVDGRGHPRALLRTTSVRQVRLADVDAEHVALEDEGDATVADWTARTTEELRRRAAGTGHVVGPDTELVLERFELRFPPRARGRAGSVAPVPAPVH